MGLRAWYAAGDEGDFVFEEGIVLLVVDRDGAAQDDEEIAGLGLGQGKARLGGIHVLDLEIARAERRLEGAKVFKSDVAEDEGARGGVAWE